MSYEPKYIYVPASYKRVLIKKKDKIDFVEKHYELCEKALGSMAESMDEMIICRNELILLVREHLSYSDKTLSSQIIYAINDIYSIVKRDKAWEENRMKRDEEMKCFIISNPLIIVAVVNLCNSKNV